VAELERRVVEISADNARMKNVVEEADNKISVLHAKNSELKADKEVVEAELDKFFYDTLELLNQSFFQGVR